MATIQEWTNTKKPFHEFISGKSDFFTAIEYLQGKFSILIDEEIYYYFLGCVPPKKREKNSFFSGEPVTWGKYDFFYIENNQYFYGGILPLNQGGV
jgi:hypothetical protein